MDLVGLTQLLEDENLSTNDRIYKLISLGKQEDVNKLLSELEASNATLYHQYAIFIANGANHKDVITKALKYPSEIVQKLAAYKAGTILDDETIIQLVSDTNLPIRVRLRLIKSVRTKNKKVLLKLFPIVAKEFGNDSAALLLPFSQETDEQIVQHLLDANIRSIKYISAWVRLRPYAVLLFVKRLYKKLVQGNDDIDFHYASAYYAVQWNQTILVSLLRTQSNEIVTALLNLLDEILLEPYRKKNIQAFQDSFKHSLLLYYGDNTLSYFARKSPSRLTQFMIDTCNSFGIDALYSICLSHFNTQVMDALTLDQLESLFDVLWKNNNNRKAKTKQGEYMIYNFLKFINGHGTYSKARKEHFYGRILQKYDEEVEVFLTENFNLISDVCILPAQSLGNLVAQRLLDKFLQNSMFKDASEEAIMLTYTDPFDDEVKRKHFESLCSNSDFEIRSICLCQYLHSAFYNNKRIKETLQFIDKRLVNEREEIYTKVLNGLSFNRKCHWMKRYWIGYEMQPKHLQVVLKNPDCWSFIESMCTNACFRNKSGPSGAMAAFTLVSCVISEAASSSDLKGVHFGLSLFEKLRKSPSLTNRNFIHYLTIVNVPFSISKQFLDALKSELDKLIEKGEFSIIRALLSHFSKPERFSEVKDLLNKIFDGSDSELKKLCTSETRVNSYKHEYEQRSDIMDLVHLFLLAEPKNKVLRVKSLLQSDPSLILAPAVQNVLFSAYISTKDREDIIGPYLTGELFTYQDFKKMANESLLFTLGDTKNSMTSIINPIVIFEKGSGSIGLKSIRSRLSEICRATILGLYGESPIEIYQFNTYRRSAPHSIMKTYIRLLARLQVEKEEIQSLYQFVEKQRAKIQDEYVQNHLLCSIIHCDSPASAFGTLLDNIKANNVMVVAPAIRRCAQYMPKMEFFNELCARIDKNIVPPAKPEEVSEQRRDTFENNNKHETEDEDWEVIEGEDDSKEVKKVDEEPKSGWGISVQKDIIRQFHAFVNDQTDIRTLVINFVCDKLWEERKSFLHKDIRATIVYLVMALLQRSSDDKLWKVIEDATQDKYQKVTSMLFKNTYHLWNNTYSIKRLLQLQYKLLEHEVDLIRKQSIASINCIIKQSPNQIAVLVGSTHIFNDVIDKMCNVAVTFKVTIGHDLAKQAINSLAEILLSGDLQNASIMFDRVLCPLLKDAKYASIDQEYNANDADVWDLPVKQRITIIVKEIYRKFCRDHQLQDVQGKASKALISPVIEALRQYDNAFYLSKLAVYLRTSLVKLNNASSVIKDLVAPLVNDLEKNDVYLPFTADALMDVLKKNESNVFTEVFIQAADVIIAEHDSNKTQDLATFRWEVFAFVLLSVAVSTSSWTSYPKRLLRQLRTRKNNHVLIVKCMRPLKYVRLSCEKT